MQDPPAFGWLDDRVVPRDALHVPADDPGLVIGDGLFETLLVRAGAPVDLTLHLARFETARAALALPRPPAEPARAIAATLAANAPLPPEACLRMTLTARPTLIVQLRQLNDRDAARRAGLALYTLPARRGETFVARYKTLAWNANAVQRRLHPEGARADFEGLWLDPDGALLEGTSTNVYAVIDGIVHTAPLSAPILPGVARERVLEILAANGVPVVERLVPCAELDRASELFATNAILPIASVFMLDGRALSRGPVGELLARVLA